MKLLIVAATELEISPLLQWLYKNWEPQRRAGSFKQDQLELHCLITGVGSMHTAHALGQELLLNLPDLAINLGVAGALNPDLVLGQLYHVRAEILGDLGAEEKDGRLLDLFDLGLLAPSNPPYINKRLYNPQADESEFLPLATGLTVNKAHGSANSIEQIRAKYPEADLESMEGAAFFFACLQAKQPFLALRSISNYVEPRNRAGWQMEKALDSLFEGAKSLLESFSK